MYNKFLLHRGFYQSKGRVVIVITVDYVFSSVISFSPSIGHNTLTSEFGRTEPNKHTIFNSHNFHPTQTQRFSLCTDLSRDLNQGIILKNYKKIIVLHETRKSIF